MDYKNVFYPETRFGGFTDIDGTVAFYTRVNALISPSSVVLDIGCGRGACGEDPVPIRRNLRIFKGRCRKVIGVDVDPAAAANPFLDEFYLLNSAAWPVESGTVDLCVADFVLEHVDDPEMFISECARVLRRGGHLCIRTPNVLSYFGLVSKLVPNRHHPTVLSWAHDKCEAEDVFPTRYRCNTIGRVRRIMRRHGFDSCVYGYEAEPSYFSFSRFFYWLAVLHQRFAPRWFRLAIYAYGRKSRGG